MNNTAKKFFAGLALAAAVTGTAFVSDSFIGQAAAAPAVQETGMVTKNGGAGWSWISSDEKYGKFFSPANVKIVAQSNGVATRISAWLKTLFSPAGAKETIDNYEINAQIPDPSQLAYTLSLVEVCPQERTIEYVQENFYDKNGTSIWQKIYEPRTVKEINSQAFDEDFYAVLVDHIFRHGEVARQKAEDRWITLWSATMPDKSRTDVIADTTTMRLRGDNIIYWEWSETKDAAGNIIEVKFSKKAVNLPQGTQKTMACRSWDTRDGWKDVTGGLDDTYREIKKGTQAEKGLARLRAFSKGYTYWLNRYRTDMPPKPAANKK